jgi:hypothetical protein
VTGSGADPDFYSSRISDPITATKDEWEIKNLLSQRYLFCSYKNLENLKFFNNEQAKKLFLLIYKEL